MQKAIERTAIAALRKIFRPRIATVAGTNDVLNQFNTGKLILSDSKSNNKVIIIPESTLDNDRYNNDTDDLLDAELVINTTNIPIASKSNSHTENLILDKKIDYAKSFTKAFSLGLIPISSLLISNDPGYWFPCLTLSTIYPIMHFSADAINKKVECYSPFPSRRITQMGEQTKSLVSKKSDKESLTPIIVPDDQVDKFTKQLIFVHSYKQLPNLSAMLLLADLHKQKGNNPEIALRIYWHVFVESTDLHSKQVYKDCLRNMIELWATEPKLHYSNWTALVVADAFERRFGFEMESMNPMRFLNAKNDDGKRRTSQPVA